MRRESQPYHSKTQGFGQRNLLRIPRIKPGTIVHFVYGFKDLPGSPTEDCQVLARGSVLRIPDQDRKTYIVVVHAIEALRGYPTSMQKNILLDSKVRIVPDRLIPLDSVAKWSSGAWITKNGAVARQQFIPPPGLDFAHGPPDVYCPRSSCGTRMVYVVAAYDNYQMSRPSKKLVQEWECPSCEKHIPYSPRSADGKNAAN